tara:strand:+ start:918 stop:1193 length:276 start_codon:yes stop_codon:yes gene_type:complete
MNRKKLVEVADEVMLDIDIEMDGELRKDLENKLCRKLSNVFDDAAGYARYGSTSYGNDVSRTKQNQREKKAYDSVKPVLDDCLDKMLGKKK